MLDVLKMNRRPTYPLLLAALALILAGPAAAAAGEADDSAQARAKLAQVRARIAELAGRLGKDLAERDAVSARLRAAELAVTADRRRLETLHAAQSAAERRRAQLRLEQQRNRAALDAERTALAGQIGAAYMIGQQEPLKLLLNQRDPAGLGRMLAYYGYFSRQRAAALDAIREHLARLQALGAEIELQSANLKSLEADARKELASLEGARAERAQALAAINLQVANGNQELARLKREESAEESLIADLERMLQDFPVDTQQPFDLMRGRLPWPVTGRLAARYHDLRADSPQSGMRWNGVLIEAARGAKVRAPYYGRVVYADWLQGLGLLIIIGHSGGYLSLYGHAEVLYKSIGDWVAPGDVIAALSDTDAGQPQLYFEIRQGRKPVDPNDWLKRVP
jgi:septal ring factor EnvC (AmiA/AmiB activator)